MYVWIECSPYHIVFISSQRNESTSPHSRYNIFTIHNIRSSKWYRYKSILTTLRWQCDISTTEKHFHLFQQRLSSVKKLWFPCSIELVLISHLARTQMPIAWITKSDCFLRKETLLIWWSIVIELDNMFCGNITVIHLFEEKNKFHARYNLIVSLIFAA